MVALTGDRNTPRREGKNRLGYAAAGSMIYAGALVMRAAATGFIHEGHTANGMVAVGRATNRVDNRMGADGDENVSFDTGQFQFANSAAADEVVLADIGQPAYVVDDQTVAKTDGGGTRSIAGFIEDVDAQGVWVRLDEALSNTI